MENNRLEQDSAVRQNLIDAGFGEDAIEKFFTLWAIGKTKEALVFLKHQRKFILEKVHVQNRCLDCLDYLIYTIGKDCEQSDRK